MLIYDLFFGKLTSRLSQAIRDYILHERKPSNKDEKALFLNNYGHSISEHFARRNLKKCAVGSGITRRVYPHILRATCIIHLLNGGVNPLTVQQHARHNCFKTTMIYNRPTQQQMKNDIERIFVKQDNITYEDRSRAMFDKYLKGEITINELRQFLEFTRPKQLNPKSELTGMPRACNRSSPHNRSTWAGNKVAMWRTADPHTGVQIPPRPLLST